MPLPKLSFKTAQYAGENARSVKRAAVHFRLFDYNDIISSNKGDRQYVRKKNYEISYFGKAVYNAQASLRREINE